MKDPSMPFYVNDWLSSPRVAGLNHIERSVYLQMLCYCWASGDCSIPADETTLRQMLGLPPGDLIVAEVFPGHDDLTMQRASTLRLRHVIETCFVAHPDDDDKLTNSKLFEVWRERQDWRDDQKKRTAAATAARKAKREKELRESEAATSRGDDVDRNDARDVQRDVVRNVPSSSSSSSSSSIKNNGRPVTRARARDAAEPPDDAPRDASPDVRPVEGEPPDGVSTACGPVSLPGGDRGDYRPLRVDAELYAAARPLMQELAHGIDPGRSLRDEDRRLAILTAVIASTRLPPEWLREVVASYQRLSETPRNRWAWVRKALVRSAGDYGVDLHRLERAVQFPPELLAPKQAQPA